VVVCGFLVGGLFCFVCVVCVFVFLVLFLFLLFGVGGGWGFEWGGGFGGGCCVSCIGGIMVGGGFLLMVGGVGLCVVLWYFVRFFVVFGGVGFGGLGLVCVVVLFCVCVFVVRVRLFCLTTETALSRVQNITGVRGQGIGRCDLWWVE